LDDASGHRVILDMAADAEADLALPHDMLEGYKHLVKEADALFGARHFASYHFLLTLSDEVAHFGLEHHQSSDNRVRERSFADPDRRTLMLGLLPHEFVHSWNGKFRRPADLMPDDFAAPIDSHLLWVYEGLTQYLGWVLAARSGLRTVDEDLQNLAETTAELDARGGRAWRSLEDTAVAAQLLFETDEPWRAWLRGTDFYNEGTLIWLDADVTIRKLTNGARSLDDFCKRFHGGGSGAAEVKTYTFDDIVADLNAVAPNDWAAFLKERLTRRGTGAPLGGIGAGGWSLGYGDTRSAYLKSWERSLSTSTFATRSGCCSTSRGRSWT
jgi:predicted metalloprotease with PDZ domain